MNALPRRILSLAAVALAAGATLAVPTMATSQSPDGVHRTLAWLGLTEDERHTLNGGFETARLLPAAMKDEISAIGAIWIEARPDTYLRWAEDFVDFDRGSSVQAVRRLSTPPVLADFDDMTLSREELQALSRCRVGSCTMQLDAESIRQVAALDWKRRDAPAQATAIMRAMMLEVARRYLASGNAGLPHYHDTRQATDVADNLASLLDQETLTRRTPAPLIAFLRGVPSHPPPGTTSHLYWTTNTFGLKPTTRLNHSVIYRSSGSGILGVIATKQLYASHYFHGGLEMRFVVGNPALDERFALVMMTRSRSDGLTGLTGAILGDRIRRSAVHSLRTYLRFTRDSVEKRQRRGWTGGPPPRDAR